MGTDIQGPGVEDEKAEQASKTMPPNQLSNSSLEPKVERPEQASPATKLQKQQISSDGNNNEHRLIRARLTRKNLALFDKMAKGKGKEASASTPPESTAKLTTTKITSTTMSGFALQALSNGILDPSSSKPPTNLKEIRERVAGSRGTASPTKSVYEGYVKKVNKAINEATMVVEVGGRLLKEYDNKGYTRAFNQAFTAFPKDAGFNNGLSTLQPDFVEGLERSEYLSFPVDEHVNGAIPSNDDPRSIILPHLAGEWKGGGQNMLNARLQSAYDGAALVYARNQALSYLGESDPPGHSEVTTFTTDGTNLNLYAHYAAPSEDGTLKYHQYPIKSTILVDSRQGLKDGRRGLRNEQDHAMKQSYAMRDQLKQHWEQLRHEIQPIVEGTPPHVPNSTLDATNADEDEADYEVVEQPCQPTHAASSQLCGESSSVSSSKSFTPMNDSIPGSGGQKRKASASQAFSQGPSHESCKRRNKGKSN